MSSVVRELYDPAMAPARARFDRSPAADMLSRPDVDPLRLERFLIHFSSLGVALTQPVEGWLTRAGRRCEELGLAEVGRALCGHAKSEAGHHLMMIEDTYALVASWNARRLPRLDAERLLARQPSRGARVYQRVHEDNIASNTPYAQVAIEYEIEMLPLRFGGLIIERCKNLLGPAVLGGLKFLRQHVVLDVGHTRFNERLLTGLLESDRERLGPLVQAGTAALDAYAAFIGDCMELAQSESFQVA